MFTSLSILAIIIRRRPDSGYWAKTLTKPPPWEVHEMKSWRSPNHSAVFSYFCSTVNTHLIMSCSLSLNLNLNHPPRLGLGESSGKYLYLAIKEVTQREITNEGS